MCSIFILNAHTEYLKLISCVSTRILYFITSLDRLSVSTVNIYIALVHMHFQWLLHGQNSMTYVVQEFLPDSKSVWTYNYAFFGDGCLL